MNEFDLGWIVGIFEGEGCVSGKAGGTDIYVAVTMCDEDVVRRLASIVGYGAITSQDARGRRKPLWRWQINGSDAEAFVRVLLPHLGQRRAARATEFLLRRERWRDYALRERECPVCHVTFRPQKLNGNSGGQKYCATACRNLRSDRAYRARMKAIGISV